MSVTPRFEHRKLPSGEHCITSPDVKGLCAIAETEVAARQGAAALLVQFQRLGLPLRPRTDPQKHRAA